MNGACPTCRARWRGTAICSRCGNDLTDLMRLAVRAFRLRERAREALLAEDMALAAGLAREAQSLCWTDAGAALEKVVRVLR